MVLDEVTYVVKCIIPGCRNNSKYLIKNEEIKVPSKICICEKCGKEIYSLLGKKIVPKSPKNILNKTIKR